MTRLFTYPRIVVWISVDELGEQILPYLAYHYFIFGTGSFGIRVVVHLAFMDRSFKVV